jgi:hypothetical protein
LSLQPLCFLRLRATYGCLKPGFFPRIEGISYITRLVT